MDAFKSDSQSKEMRADDDFVPVAWAFCLTPSVICPLIHGGCRLIVWEMKKSFWNERRFERGRPFCGVALVVAASRGSPEVKGIMITLQPRRSFSGLRIPPGWPLHEERPFWLLMKLDGTWMFCYERSVAVVQFRRFILTRWRSFFRERPWLFTGCLGLAINVV